MPGGDAEAAVATPGRSAPEAGETRGWGLSIAVWLVLGFVVVIAAFVTGAVLAKRGTHLATDELLRVQSEMEPLTRTAREFGESAAAFERAVLSFLGTDSDGNRAKLVRKNADGTHENIKVRLEDLLEDGDMSQNLAVQPGDVLIIPESRF